MSGFCCKTLSDSPQDKAHIPSPLLWLQSSATDLSTNLTNETRMKSNETAIPANLVSSSYSDTGVWLLPSCFQSDQVLLLPRDTKEFPNFHSNLQHARFCPSEKTCHLNLLNLLTCVSVQPLFLQELSTMHTSVQMCFLDWTEFNHRTVTSRTRATMLFPLCVSSPILNCRCEVFVDWLHNWTQE